MDHRVDKHATTDYSQILKYAQILSTCVLETPGNSRSFDNEWKFLQVWLYTLEKI